MKKIYFFLISTVILLATVFVCLLLIPKARLFTNNLEELDKVDQIKLSVLSGINENGVPDEVRPLRVIDDPEQIDRIVTKFQVFSDNWQYEEFSPSWTGISGRIAPLQITFYKRRKS